ncbi:VaFE repeat-containing surface-anchored protein [Leucobacter ruminantium]
MQTLAYVVSAASDAVLYQEGKVADDHAAAAAVIIHDMTNSNPAVYDPEWPLAAFDDNEDPAGTGQITTAVRGVYNTLLSDAALYSGQWQIVWDAVPSDLVVGDSVQLSGTLSTISSTPIPNRELRIAASGIDLDAATASTDATGRFEVTGLVQSTSGSVTASITSPATTVMMREPVSWPSGDRPQNMILIDDSPLESAIPFEAEVAPAIGTSARDQADGDRIIPADGGTVIDTVTYEGLTPGVEYTLEGELYDKATGQGTGITGSTTFTPDQSSGTVEVTFTIPVGFAGTSLVVFEYLYDPDSTLVAEHADIDDEAQTVVVEAYVPAIGTSARDQADGDRIIPADGGTVIDTVTYEGLTPGVEYTLEGVMVEKPSGKRTSIEGFAIFTPETSSGTVEVKFRVPSGHAGKTLVVFEYLYDADGNLVTEHADINDEAQTITVLSVTPERPSLPTTGSSDAYVPIALTGAALLIALGVAAMLVTRRKQYQK